MADVKRFEELLRSDEGLQAKLRDAMDAFQGDPSDGRAVFDAVVTPLAEELGIPVTFDEYMEYVSEGAEFSDDELDALSGGLSYCFAFGGGDVEKFACWGKERRGAVACAHFGVGFFDNKPGHPEPGVDYD